jgi:hypothetical protein
VDRIATKVLTVIVAALCAVLLLTAVDPLTAIRELTAQRITWQGLTLRIPDGASYDLQSAQQLASTSNSLFNEPSFNQLMQTTADADCVQIRQASWSTVICVADLGLAIDGSPLNAQQDRNLFEYATAIRDLVLQSNDVIVEELPTVRSNLLSSGTTVSSYIRQFSLAGQVLYGLSLETPAGERQIRAEIRAWGFGPEGGLSLVMLGPDVALLERELQRMGD